MERAEADRADVLAAQRKQFARIEAVIPVPFGRLVQKPRVYSFPADVIMNLAWQAHSGRERYALKSR